MKKVSCVRETEMVRIQKELKLSEAMKPTFDSFTLSLPDGRSVKIENFTLLKEVVAA